MARLCPSCGRPVLGPTCPRCGAGRSCSARSPEAERARRERRPERARYSSAAYRRACQVVLASTGGRCASCGVRVADRLDGRWRFRPGAGGCHHVVPLVEGGADAPGNLVPLCARCHNRLDAELRRRRANGGDR
ncbi:HNH endonuclease [uncultured Parolsenella sp.]|uniref:HNH endonuclease n=1 Tax=uncultured Parolsenella sp. TaxID=2083008 RepID=UPI0027D93EE7|nr:HNH endonuclease [uncultured Parolsenella sp.]